MTKDNTAPLLPATPADRRTLSLASVSFFDSYYCGMRYAPHREEWFNRFETTWNTARDAGDKGRLLVLAPRDHGKTEAAITFTVRAICLNRDVRILWICESAAQAEKRMRRVKHLLRSPRIREDWAEGSGLPSFEGEESPWTNTQVYVPRPTHSVDPTLSSIGCGGAITGAHYDLVLSDDLESDLSCHTHAARSKTKRWFKATVLPMLSKKGMFVMIGTRKHHDDLYSSVLEDPSWSVENKAAILKWPEKFSFKTKLEGGREVISGVDVVGPYAVLWPAERPLEYLLRERRSMGAQLFAREFLNQVQADEAAPFKWEWIEAAKARGAEFSLYELPPVELEIVQGWDFSLVSSVAHAEKRDTDYTVGTTWGRDPKTGDHYLLGLWRKRGLTPAQLQSAVVSEYERFGGAVRSVAVERNAFGEIHYVGLASSTDLPLVPHLTTGAKKADPWQGVASLSVLFERGKVILPTGAKRDREAIEPLCVELWGLGRESHDDCVLSLWIAHTVLRVHRFQHCFIDSQGREHSDDGSVIEPEVQTGLAAFWQNIQH